MQKIRVIATFETVVHGEIYYLNARYITNKPGNSSSRLKEYIVSLLMVASVYFGSVNWSRVIFHVETHYFWNYMLEIN